MILFSPLRGNKSQFIAFAEIKTRIDTCMIQLDELQLEEADSDSSRYAAIGGVKTEMEAALETIDKRLDLIQRADSSKVGWPAATIYEKSLTKSSSVEAEKLWIEAEKKATESQKQKSSYGKFNNQPFRRGPVSAGFRKGNYLALSVLCGLGRVLDLNSSL